MFAWLKKLFAARNRHPETPGQGMITRTCKICGKTFALPEDVQHWPDLCQECRAKYRPVEDLTRTCPKCGRSFTFPSDEQPWPKYCPECRAKRTAEQKDHAKKKRGGWINGLFRRILPLLGICLLSGCTGFNGRKDVVQDGIYYRVSDNGRQAYAYVLFWDLDPTHTDYTVADTVNGARVDAIGGIYGTGVHCPLMIRAEEGLDYIDASPKYYESEVPFHEEEIEFTVRIGPVICFICDPENRTFYSEDGRLYYRKDGTPAEDMQSRQRCICVQGA